MDKTEGSLLTAKSIAPLLAGISGGTVSTVLLLPLDNVKVRLQVNEDTRPSSTTSGNRSFKQFRAVRLLRGIVKHEGWTGLYQGLTPAVVGSAVSWGGYFFLYEGFKQRLKDHKSTLPNGSPTLTSWDNFYLACSSGAIMVFATNPVWLIKLRMQLQMKQSAQHLHAKQPYAGMLDAARTIVREEGLWALYKGTGPALLLTTHGGVQFVVYEFLRKHFLYTRTPRESNDGYQPVLERLEKSLGYLTIGATAKIIASTTTYPLQVVKARMQQRSEVVELTAEGDVRLVRREYVGLLKTGRRIWQKEGVVGFFGGCIPNAIRVAPSAAVTFVVYEAVMDWLKVD
jgi:solute carrier family 25 folate transporter 32